MQHIITIMCSTVIERVSVCEREREKERADEHLGISVYRSHYTHGSCFEEQAALKHLENVHIRTVSSKCENRSLMQVTVLLAAAP